MKKPTSYSGIDDLRRLLVEGEAKRITKLENRLKTWPRPEDVARALPDAIKACEAQGDALEEALGSPAMKALKVSVREEPEPLAEALFPLLGPMIKRYVQSSLTGMVKSLNQATEHSFNFALRYRAWRAGMSVGQYALLHKLVYRVEQVYLIHNETGLALVSIHNERVEGADPDMVAGMLTAITDFVRDSLRAEETETLEHISMGPHQILISPGKRMSVAVAVRGVPPQELLERMDELVEHLHFTHSVDLEEFSGDSTPFERSEAFLSKLLQMETVPPSGPSVSTKLFLAGLSMAVCLGLGLMAWQWQRFHTLVGELEDAPGILVTETRFSPLGNHVVEGLRDPDSIQPDILAAATGLEPRKVTYRWEAYKSLEPELVEARIQAVFTPPDTATLSFREGELTAIGRASKSWRERASLLAASLPGIEKYDDRGLEDIDPLGRIEDLLDPPNTVSLGLEGKVLTLNGAATHAWLKRARELAQTSEDVEQYEDGSVVDLDRAAFDKIKSSLEAYSIYFDSGTSAFRGAARETIGKAADDWEKLLEQAEILELKVTLQVTGQADSTGTKEQNAKLSKQRAGRVRDRLVELGVLKEQTSVEAIQAEGEDPRLRRVIFLVLIG